MMKKTLGCSQVGKALDSDSSIRGFEPCRPCHMKNNKSHTLNLHLTKKEMRLILKWYYKGYTHIDEDKPLFDKLKYIYSKG
jgi:hypothetical protein